jgi:hypothetical protein
MDYGYLRSELFSSLPLRHLKLGNDKNTASQEHPFSWLTTTGARDPPFPMLDNFSMSILLTAFG